MPTDPTIQSKVDYEAGQVMLFNKPYGWTSFDLVRKVRGLIRIRKIGHAGTLDPLATGLMILCTGKFTKRINEFMGQEKEYVAEMTLGAVTPTYDLESEPEQFKPCDAITSQDIEQVLQRYRGPILQIPKPMIFKKLQKHLRRKIKHLRRRCGPYGCAHGK